MIGGSRRTSVLQDGSRYSLQDEAAHNPVRSVDIAAAREMAAMAVIASGGTTKEASNAAARATIKVEEMFSSLSIPGMSKTATNDASNRRVYGHSSERNDKGGMGAISHDIKIILGLPTEPEPELTSEERSPSSIWRKEGRDGDPLEVQDEDDLDQLKGRVSMALGSMEDTILNQAKRSKKHSEVLQKDPWLAAQDPLDQDQDQDVDQDEIVDRIVHRLDIYDALKMKKSGRERLGISGQVRGAPPVYLPQRTPPRKSPAGSATAMQQSIRTSKQQLGLDTDERTGSQLVWRCGKECGFEHKDYALVVKHEATCSGLNPYSPCSPVEYYTSAGEKIRSPIHIRSHIDELRDYPDMWDADGENRKRQNDNELSMLRSRHHLGSSRSGSRSLSSVRFNRSRVESLGVEDITPRLSREVDVVDQAEEHETKILEALNGMREAELATRTFEAKYGLDVPTHTPDALDSYVLEKVEEPYLSPSPSFMEEHQDMMDLKEFKRRCNNALESMEDSILSQVKDVATTETLMASSEEGEKEEYNLQEDEAYESSRWETKRMPKGQEREVRYVTRIKL